MRRIAFISEKGGTGKTTLCVNVAAYLALHAKVKVLVIDMDGQGHAGKSLGLDVRTLSPTALEWLAQGLPLSAVARPTAVAGLDVVPANKSMGDLPLLLAALPGREKRLQAALLGLVGYDYVLFDSPPSTGLAQLNILLAADELVVPVSLTYFGLDGIAELQHTVKQVAQDHARPALRITQVVPTMARQSSLSDEVLDKLRSYFPEVLTKTALGYSVKIDEAQSHGQPIWTYAPRSKGAQDLKAIAEELRKRPSQRELHREPKLAQAEAP